MINPGVITLSTKKIAGSLAIIEDNIGESIHFHYGNIRIDMSFEEFNEITNIFVEVARDMVGDIFDELLKYDPVFLNFISEQITDLVRIEETRAKLNDFVVYTRVTKNNYGWAHLNKSLMYRAINGDTNDYSHYVQDNQPFMNNMDRLNGINDMISKENEFGDIVLLNDGYVILDGQHRSACLLHKYGNITITVKRFIFKKYDINYTIHCRFYYLFKNCLRFVKQIIKGRK